MRTIKIHYCDDCPFFDDFSPGYFEECSKLSRRVPINDGGQHPIPEWCPLEDVTECEGPEESDE